MKLTFHINIFLYICQFETNIIDNRFVDTSIQIALATDEDLIIADDLTEFSLESYKILNKKQFEGTNRYSTKAILRKFGQKYKISIGEGNLCIKKNRKIGRCLDKNDMWKIRRKKDSYQIHRKNMCLTQNNENIFLEKCEKINVSKNQYFKFKVKSKIEKCLERFNELSRIARKNKSDKLIKKIDNKIDQIMKINKENLPNNIYFIKPTKIKDSNKSTDISKLFPGIEKSPNSKEALQSLYDSWDWPNYKFKFPFKFFC